MPDQRGPEAHHVVEVDDAWARYIEAREVENVRYRKRIDRAAKPLPASGDRDDFRRLDGDEGSG